jgi:hypothetical protein
VSVQRLLPVPASAGHGTGCYRFVLADCTLTAHPRPGEQHSLRTHAPGEQPERHQARRSPGAAGSVGGGVGVGGGGSAAAPAGAPAAAGQRGQRRGEPGARRQGGVGERAAAGAAAGAQRAHPHRSHCAPTARPPRTVPRAPLRSHCAFTAHSENEMLQWCAGGVAQRRAVVCGGVRRRARWRAAVRAAPCAQHRSVLQHRLAASFAARSRSEPTGRAVPRAVSRAVRSAPAAPRTVLASFSQRCRNVPCPHTPAPPRASCPAPPLLRRAPCAYGAAPSAVAALSANDGRARLLLGYGGHPGRVSG